MKIFKIILIITVFILPIKVFWVCEDDNEKINFINSFWFDLYKERVELICEPYLYIDNCTKNSKIRNIVEIPDNYLEVTKKNPYNLNKAKQTHVENMNNIYKCWILNTQIKSLELIKNDIAKQNNSISKSIWPKIDSQINKLNLKISNLWCKKDLTKDPLIKQYILKQVTYQTCKYHSYLEYLREENTKIINQIEDNYKESYSINEIMISERKNVIEIDNEINHIYEVFPLTFSAYNEYENNITVHFLLELIKQDYFILKQKYHNVINPINQLVYKLINVMRP